MSEHDIADCPKCGKRDYVLKEDGVWICLNCRHTDKMPKSKFDSESEANSGIVGVLIPAFVIAMFLVIALGGRLPPVPNSSQNVNQEHRNIIK